MSQTPTIPVAPSAELSACPQIPIADSFPSGPYDFFQVTVDGHLLYSTNDDDPFAGDLGHGLRTIHVTSIADGDTHTLRFSGSFDPSGVTHLFVDAIALMASPSPLLSLMLSIGIGVLIALARLRGVPLFQ